MDRQTDTSPKGPSIQYLNARKLSSSNCGTASGEEDDY